MEAEKKSELTITLIAAIQDVASAFFGRLASNAYTHVYTHPHMHTHTRSTTECAMLSVTSRSLKSLFPLLGAHVPTTWMTSRHLSSVSSNVVSSGKT